MCFNCSNNKFIAGTRLKCANCPNLDACSDAVCEQKHLLTHPNHTFIIIDQPLPLAPEKRSLPAPQPLLPQPFDFQEPTTNVHSLACDACNKQIEGTR